MLSPLLGSRAIEPDFPKYCYFPFPPLFHPQSLHATSSKRLMLWAETRDFACEIAVTSGLKKIDSPISNSNQFSLEILDIDHKRQDRSFNKCILRSMAFLCRWSLVNLTRQAFLQNKMWLCEKTENSRSCSAEGINKSQGRCLGTFKT